MPLAGLLALAAAGCTSDDGDGGPTDEQPADEQPAGECEGLPELEMTTELGPDADAADAADAIEPAVEIEEGPTMLTGCDPEPADGTIWALTAPDRDTGNEVRLCEYRGEVVLIVNTAAL